MARLLPPQQGAPGKGPERSPANDRRDVRAAADFLTPAPPGPHLPAGLGAVRRGACARPRPAVCWAPAGSLRCRVRDRAGRKRPPAGG